MFTMTALLLADLMNIHILLLLLQNMRINIFHTRPEKIPIAALQTSIFTIVTAGTALEIMIGSISSEVDRYTAISVPTVITRPEKRLDAASYKAYADRIMHSLASPDYRAALGTNGNFILMHSVGVFRTIVKLTYL